MVALYMTCNTFLHILALIVMYAEKLAVNYGKVGYRDRLCTVVVADVRSMIYAINVSTIMGSVVTIVARTISL